VRCLEHGVHGRIGRIAVLNVVAAKNVEGGCVLVDHIV